MLTKYWKTNAAYCKQLKIKANKKNGPRENRNNKITTKSTSCK